MNPEHVIVYGLKYIPSIEQQTNSLGVS